MPLRYVTTGRHSVHEMTDPGEPSDKMCLSNAAMPADQALTKVPKMAIDVIKSFVPAFIAVEQGIKFVRGSYGILPFPQVADCSPVGLMPHGCGGCQAVSGRLTRECGFDGSRART
jgi:hypothetical protein